MPKRLAQISKSKLQSAMLAGRDHEERDRTGSAVPGMGFRISDNQILIKNSSGGDLARGAILEIGDNQLTQIDRGKLWHDGTQPSGSDIDFAILLRPAKPDQWQDAQLAGACIAKLNVTDTGHTHAQPAASEDLLQSAASGPVKILGSVDSTGEQEVAIKFVAAPATILRYTVSFSKTGSGLCTIAELTGRGNVGGFSISANTIIVPQDGVYRCQFTGASTITSLNTFTAFRINDDANLGNSFFVPNLRADDGSHGVVITAGSWSVPLTGMFFVERDEGEPLSMYQRGTGGVGDGAGVFSVSYDGPLP